MNLGSESMEYVIIPSKETDIDKYKNQGIKTFIVGLKNFSTGYKTILDLEQIKKLSNEVNLFVAINKMIENEELKQLEEILLFLNNTNTKGILYYDLSIVSFHKKNNLKVNLVWNQTHMVTNYNTANFYYKENVKYGYLASEITLDEIVEINEKSKMSFFVNIISHPIMSHSKRTLLTNYFKASNISKEHENYLLSEKNNPCNFIIDEDKTGTTIRYGNIINGTSAIKKLLESKISYLVIDTSYIDDNVIIKVLPLLQDILTITNLEDSKYQQILKELEKILGSDTGFFYKKTIYKVKKGEN